MNIKMVFTILISIFFTQIACASDICWQKRSFTLSDSGFTCIACDPENPDTLYIGTDRYLYKSINGGIGWKVSFQSEGEQKGISDIFMGRDRVVYISTKNGLFISKDKGKKWTESISYKSLDEQNIKSFTMDINSKNFYILTDKGLYKGKDNSRSLEELYVDLNQKEEPDFQEDEEYSRDDLVLTKITIDKDNVLYLSTNRGIFTSNDEGKMWRMLDAGGAFPEDVNFCLVPRYNGKDVYAATIKGVFRLGPERLRWENLYNGLDKTNITGISFNSTDENSF